MKNIKDLNPKNNNLLLKQIDKLNENSKEWDKVNIILKERNFLNFIRKVKNINKDEISKISKKFLNDDRFKNSIQKKLIKIEKRKSMGDVRFHSFTIYLIVRILKPKIMLETGVCNGKSTSMILLAMNHNNCGKLISIDKTKKINKDGSRYSLIKNKTGYLIPAYLKKKWIFKRGDSIKVLKNLKLKKNEFVDIFFHDSLHTYEHTKNEISEILKMIDLKKKFCMIVDDIDLGAGKAFNKFLDKNKTFGYSFKNLGIFNGKINI